MEVKWIEEGERERETEQRGNEKPKQLENEAKKQQQTSYKNESQQWWNEKPL